MIASTSILLDAALTLRMQDNRFHACGVKIRIEIRTDVLTVLNWAQTACKCYKQTAKAAISRQTVNASIM